VLRDLVRYWRHDYDWKRVQSDLNRLPHYRLPVEGERLHFVWYRRTGPRQPFPLLLLHGWPSSFLEYAKVAEPLMRGGAGQPGFDLVVPSLPGYVFSDAPRRPGMHPGEIADRMHELMRTLGYRRYGVAAGDWGAVVGRDLAKAHAEAVTGLAWPGTPWVRPPKERALTDEERAFLEAWDRFDAEELAYFRLQSTKPQTLAYALQDSPVGLLAWVLEKFWAWSDLGPDRGRGGRNGPGDLRATLDRADVLTPTTPYWLTGTVLSASRLYYENEHRPPTSQIAGPVAVPTLAMGFPTRSRRPRSRCWTPTASRRWSASRRSRAAGTSRRWSSRSSGPTTCSPFLRASRNSLRVTIESNAARLTPTALRAHACRA